MPMHDEHEHHEKHHMSEPEMVNALKSCLDDIITYLWGGTHWHQKAANCSRVYIHLRGLGRQHEMLSKVDYEAMQRLSKLAGDNIGHVANVDMEKVTKAEAWMMKDMNAFFNHFPIWVSREKEYAECIKAAIHYARELLDEELYKELFCLAGRVKKEIKRVNMLEERIEAGGRLPHDIFGISKEMHDAYEYGKIGPEDVMDINYG